MEKLGLFYVRFMDDILVLAPSRWKLRRAVKLVNERLASLDLNKHPDKTFIGRIERGFDFLGYHYSRRPLRLAAQPIEQFRTQLHRLYEQRKKAPEGAVSVVKYVTRWIRWTQAGLDGLDPFYLTEALARVTDTGKPDH